MIEERKASEKFIKKEFMNDPEYEQLVRRFALVRKSNLVGREKTSAMKAVAFELKKYHQKRAKTQGKK